MLQKCVSAVSRLWRGGTGESCRQRVRTDQRTLIEITFIILVSWLVGHVSTDAQLTYNHIIYPPDPPLPHPLLSLCHVRGFFKKSDCTVEPGPLCDHMFTHQCTEQRLEPSTG